MSAIFPNHKLAAAAVSPEFRAVSGLLAKANVDPEAIFAAGEPLSIARLDQMLAKAHLSTVERIALKSTLSRLGLLR